MHLLSEPFMPGVYSKKEGTKTRTEEENI